MKKHYLCIVKQLKTIWKVTNMKLIDKDKVLAEIEKIKKEDYYDIHDEYDGFVRNALDKLLLFINTLEVKEADLD